ncbi:hypothetical protein [Ktedonospora formicarum]|uniref:hypothetical protein n=1 Tax=Ktedonospora formicarum TaxID=2778364 RepID=UPI001C69073E|nr:hypothetical protein [Ktedonospora formicarum]
MPPRRGCGSRARPGLVGPTPLTDLTPQPAQGHQPDQPVPEQLEGARHQTAPHPPVDGSQFGVEQHLHPDPADDHLRRLLPQDGQEVLHVVVHQQVAVCGLGVHAAEGVPDQFRDRDAADRAEQDATQDGQHARQELLPERAVQLVVVLARPAPGTPQSLQPRVERDERVEHERPPVDPQQRHTEQGQDQTRAREQHEQGRRPRGVDVPLLRRLLVALVEQVAPAQPRDVAEQGLHGRDIAEGETQLRREQVGDGVAQATSPHRVDEADPDLASVHRSRLLRRTGRGLLPARLLLQTTRPVVRVPVTPPEADEADEDGATHQDRRPQAPDGEPRAGRSVVLVHVLPQVATELNCVEVDPATQEHADETGDGRRSDEDRRAQTPEGQAGTPEDAQHGETRDDKYELAQRGTAAREPLALDDELTQQRARTREPLVLGAEIRHFFLHYITQCSDICPNKLSAIFVAPTLVQN